MISVPGNASISQPLFLANDAITSETLRKALDKVEETTAAGHAYPREELQKRLRERVTEIVLAETEVSSRKLQMVHKYWMTALPVVSTAELLAMDTGWVAPRLFWLFDARLRLLENGDTSRLGPDDHYFELQRNVGFNFFAREIEYEGVRLIIPKLTRAGNLSGVGLFNVTPVLRASNLFGYAKFLSALDRDSVAKLLPAGLYLSNDTNQ